jgi:cation:H+ antiporter
MEENLMTIIDFFTHTWYGSLIFMTCCSVVIAKGCDVFECSTDFLGRNMSEGVKGATLNAIGSSMPELFTTVFFLVFATDENLGRDLAASIGGDTGSAIFNSIIIPMLVIWVVLTMGIRGVSLTKKVILRDGLFLIAAEILLLVLLSSDYITTWHGWLFTAFYFVYLFYTIFSMKTSENSDEDNGESDDEDDSSAWWERYQFKSESGRVRRSWILLSGSTLVIALACAGLVEGCKGMADTLKLNPLFIALVLVAAASSVPDTIISLKDARKGNHDDALSNVLGSNIFDITISMGLPLAVFLMITGQRIDFTVSGPTLIDIRVMLLVITIITMAIYYFSNELKTRHVVFLGILYIIFILYAIGAADYLAEGKLPRLSEPVGAFIEFLRKPGGIQDTLQNIANFITGSW